MSNDFVKHIKVSIPSSKKLFSAKLLVLSGAPMENGRNSEVVAIGDPYSSCKIPYTNTFDFQDGFGTLVDNEILICPGWNGNDTIYQHCWILSKDNTRLLKLQDPRIAAASILLEFSNLLVVRNCKCKSGYY